MSIGDGKDSELHQKVPILNIYVKKSNVRIVRLSLLLIATILIYAVESLPQLSQLRHRLCYDYQRDDSRTVPDSLRP
jgi:hypothetical protein